MIELQEHSFQVSDSAPSSSNVYPPAKQAGLGCLVEGVQCLAVGYVVQILTQGLG